MTLAEALEPLYRSYLRRLDEMVARLPDGAALTERTTPAVDGRLALGGDGLPPPLRRGGRARRAHL